MKKVFPIILCFFSLNCFTQNLVRGDTIEFDTITFEAHREYLRIDTSSQNLWEIGTPRKLFLDEAYSKTRGIITDSSTSYSVNNHSFFELKFVEEEKPFDIQHYSFGLEFKHKFDTDTLRDGGYITISYDNGQSWTNIIHDSAWRYCRTPNPWEDKNLYFDADSLFISECGFSGRSNGWISTSFSWQMCMVKGSRSVFDTILIRFNFVSDSIDSLKEGWLIDDIRLFSIALGSNTYSESSNYELHLYPNPARNNTLIKSTKVITRLDVIGMDGRYIETYFPYSDEILLDLSSFVKGVYLLKAFDGTGNVETLKLIVIE